MGWKEFWASVIGSLVTLGWPLVVLVIVILLMTKFREEFTSLIGRLRKAKIFGVEGEFSERVADAEANAEEVAADVPADQQEPQSRKPSGGMDPIGSMILSYERLTELVIELYETARPEFEWPDLPRNADGTPRPTGFVTAFRQLRKAGVISQEAGHVIDELRTLRNAVAHGKVVPDESSAESFVDAAFDMIRYLLSKMRTEDFMAGNADGSKH